MDVHGMKTEGWFWKRRVEETLYKKDWIHLQCTGKGDAK